MSKVSTFLLKPNEQELAEWFDEEIVETEYVNYCKKLLAAGAQNVLLSLGGSGRDLCERKLLLDRKTPRKEKVVNTACAGDTLLATFLAGLIKEENSADCFKDSLAAGSSTAFQKD